MGLNDLLPQVLIVETFLGVLRHGCLELLQLGFGRLRWPLRWFQGLQLLGQVPCAVSAHGGNALGFELTIEVRDVHHLMACHHHPNGTRSTHRGGTVRADAPGTAVLETQHITGDHVLVVVTPGVRIQSLGAKHSFVALNQRLDQCGGLHDHRRTTRLGTRVLGTSPSSTLGKFEVETAQQAVLAAVHVDHLQRLDPVGPRLIEPFHFHLSTEVFVLRTQTTYATALIAELVAGRLVLETCQRLTIGT
mmetsp:Transcript_23543/g.48847  ORF Transcript_23543/g.48847 Transcript_23543/m.48847 type:complete len:248 (-) Transcript_23543:157-900(-)